MHVLGVLITKRQAWCSLAICLLFVSVLISTTVFVRCLKLERELNKLAAQLTESRALYEMRMQHAFERVDGLERVLYGDLTAQVDQNTEDIKQRKPIIVTPEMWMRNRDRELRARIEKLEHWRLGWEGR